jgi:hypothetical protein
LENQTHFGPSGEDHDVELFHRWAGLNVEMDKLAKQHINVARTMPRHYLVLHESWSLWIKGVKVTSDMLHRLYDHIHSKEALSYRSGKLSEQSLIAESVNWTAIHKAMKTISRGRRIFISKHSAGMCGVGKFMKRWKQRDTNACPR